MVCPQMSQLKRRSGPRGTVSTAWNIKDTPIPHSHVPSTGHVHAVKSTWCFQALRHTGTRAHAHATRRGQSAVRNVQCGCGHYNSISHKDAISQPIHHPPMQTCTHTCRKNSLLTLHMCNTWTPNAAPRINSVHMDSLTQKPQPQRCVPTCRTQGPKPAERSDPKRLSSRCETYMHALTHTARLTPYAIVNVKRKTDNVAILEVRMHCTSDNPGARANATRRWQGLAKPSGSLPILNGRYVSHRDNLREMFRDQEGRH
jgi:hypothetical protein